MRCSSLESPKDIKRCFAMVEQCVIQQQKWGNPTDLCERNTVEGILWRKYQALEAVQKRQRIKPAVGEVDRSQVRTLGPQDVRRTGLRTQIQPQKRALPRSVASERIKRTASDTKGIQHY